MISDMMLVMCSKVNMLDWKFCLHADYIEIAIFGVYGTPLQHKCAYSKTNMKMLQAACKDKFGILLPTWTNTSQNSVTSKVPGFHADLKNFMYKCMYQLIDSVAIVALTIPNLSDKKILLLLKSLNQLHISILCNDYCI